MEAKLKTLKVADLKEVCSRANIPTTTRSTKADLITKILASQPAMNAYNAKYQQNGNAAPSSNPAAQSTNDDILAPPEEVDWTLQEPSPPVPVPATASKALKANPANPATKPAPASPTKPQSKAIPPKTTPGASETSKTSAPTADAPVDDELEKRKARATRFGIALVEPPKPKPKTKANPTPAPASKAAQAPDNPEKLKARTQRFGIAQVGQKEAVIVPAVSSNKKRGAAVVEEVDPEEQERRRKRAERFGISAVGAKA